jgi:DNA-directed RNA polymerase specialized sigma24 family protein
MLPAPLDADTVASMSETGPVRRIGGKQEAQGLQTREPHPATLATSEIKAAIEALPHAGWLRLHRIARALSRHTGIEPADLLQEAFQRALDGSRRCPGDVDVLRFLAGVMRSIASDWCKARRRWQRLQLVAPAAVLEVVMLQVRDLRPTPDDALASEQEAARAITAIRGLFADDAVALRLLEGMLDGLEGEALRSLASLSETAFASKRRHIRRRIDKAFPRDREP